MVDELDVRPERESLRAAIEAHVRSGVRIALAVADYEAAGQYGIDGSLTMQAWLRHETGLDPHAAVKLTVTGRKLRALPVLASAVLDGSMSGGQLEVVLANVPARHMALFAEHEPELVPALSALTVEQTRTAMQDWARKADALDRLHPQPDRPNELFLSKTLDARSVMHGSFDADATATIDAALRVADPHDMSCTLSERRAHALAQVCQHFLDHQRTRVGGRHRPHLNVVIDADDLDAGVGGRYVDTGQPVSPAALGALKCDSAYHRLLYSGVSGILDYGRATRSWPVDLYNAIALRDGGCRFGNCDAPPAWCDVHHVIPVEDGGETSIHSGVMGCRRHHHLAHKPGYHFKLLPDGTTEFTHPNGLVEISHPRGPSTDRFKRRRRTAA